MMLKTKSYRMLIAGIAVVVLMIPSSPVSASPSVDSLNLDTQKYCLGELATIVYTGYDATVLGTVGDDVIYVSGGWNTIYAGDGDDRICVDGHFNSLFGEDGDDTIVAAGLHNQMSGGDGDDHMTAADPGSTMQGDDGRNRCNNESC